jgi:hypothetical protein
MDSFLVYFSPSKMSGVSIDRDVIFDASVEFEIKKLQRERGAIDRIIILKPVSLRSQVTGVREI